MTKPLSAPDIIRPVPTPFPRGRELASELEREEDRERRLREITEREMPDDR